MQTRFFFTSRVYFVSQRFCLELALLESTNYVSLDYLFNILRIFFNYKHSFIRTHSIHLVIALRDAFVIALNAMLSVDFSVAIS